MIYYQGKTDQLPRFRFSGKEHLVPPTMHKSRTTDCCILYYIVSGHLLLEEDGQRLELLPGDVCLFGKGEMQRPLACSECAYYFLHFDMPLIAADIEDETALLTGIRNRFLADVIHTEPQQNELFLPRQFHLSGKATKKEMEKYFEANGTKERFRKREYHTSISAIRLLEFLINLYRINADQKIEADPVAESIVSFLEENYWQNITGPFLEEHFHYSFDYLNRKFKSVTGKTVFAYLREVRISNATKLLQISSLSVSEIAQQCGFCDLYYFSRAYKKETGKVPTAVRTQKPSA